MWSHPLARSFSVIFDDVTFDNGNPDTRFADPARLQPLVPLAVRMGLQSTSKLMEKREEQNFEDRERKRENEKAAS